MTKRIFIIILCLSTICIIANDLDTTIFNNEYEKQVFKKFTESKEYLPLELFTCIEVDKWNSNNEKLNNLIQELDKTGIKDASVGKKLKTIHKTIHNSYLKKYVAGTYLNDLLEKGSFNCLTASALYSLVFNNYYLPFYINETPNHVYLMVNNGKKDIKIETLLSEDGILYYDEKFMRNYISYLNEQKIVSDEEFKSIPLDTLFKQHYTSDKRIDIVQLAGLQYYNKGISLFDKSLYYDALKNFEKGEILYPGSNSIKYMKDVSLLKILTDNSVKKLYDGKILAKYLNANINNEEALINGLNFYKDAANNLIIVKPDLHKYNSFFEDFKKYAYDSLNIDEILQFHHFFKAYYYSTEYEYFKALYHLKPAYDFNPDNIQIKQFITEIAGAYLFSDIYYNIDIDSVKYYVKQFPFLKKDKKFGSFLLISYGVTLENNFRENKIADGFLCLDMIEDIIENSELSEKDRFIVENSYGQVSSYYIRTLNFNKASEILKKGLKNIPDSEYLKQKLSELEDNQNELYKFVAKNPNLYKHTGSSTIMKADSKEEINNNVKAYLKKCWYSDKVFNNDKFEDIPVKERILFIFSNSTVKMITEESDEEGYWKYDEQKCILTLQENEKDKHKLFLKILEMNEESMKVVMYYNLENIEGFLYLKQCNN